MQLFLLAIIAALSFQQTESFDQLVGWSGSEIEVRVRSKSLVNGVWECGEGDVQILFPLDQATNMSFSGAGTFHCTYKDRRDPSVLLDETTIRVEPYEKLPLTQLSGSLVYALMSLQYNYLTLSHRFYATKTYFPNIAKFFRGYMDKTASMLDQVVTYILAKQVTTSVLDGTNPPNYLKELFNSDVFFESGLSPEIHVSLDQTPRLAQAFSKSFHLERDVVQGLTSIGLSARELGDTQLEEFIFADLVPPLMKSMKRLMDYRNVLRSVTTVDTGLGEFMFDREFS